VRAGRWLDRLITPGSVFLGSMPIFWLGLMAVLVFYRVLDLLPAGGRLTVGLTPPSVVTGMLLIDTLLARNLGVFADALRHLILPACILSLISLAMITRVTRAAMLDILHEDYLRTARAKGLSETTVVLKHALRNASVPIVTVVGIQLGQLIGGVVVTETIFSWPGLGLYAVTAVENQDYPAIMAFTLLTTVVYVVINLLVDLLYPLLNPQTRT
jgi:peptide/nickel transport system permease protein